MPSWTPSADTAAIVLVTTSQRIRDEAARVAVAAGLSLTPAATVNEALALRPAVVLLDSDLARHPVTGCAVVVVGLEEDESAAWAAASLCNADRVAILPHASAWLAEHLGALRRPQHQGSIVGVMGATGGAGASSLACWLAACAAARDLRPLLVDGDPLGGGLELALGTELQSGVRWPDLGEVRGILNPDQLSHALPSMNGFSLLSMGTEPPVLGVLGSAAVPPVMEAARTAFDLSVVDVPRGWSADGSLLPYCDNILLVVPGRVRAISAARALVEQLQPLPVFSVVRGPLGADLDHRTVADAVGVPGMGWLPHFRAAAGAENQGQILDLARHRAVRAIAGAVLDAVLPADVGVAA